MRILLLDGSDRPNSAALPRELSTRRIRVESAATLNEGVALAGQKKFSAIVIERRAQPAEAVRRLRADSGTPIVVLREVKDADEAIACLENGADDVLVEPLDIDELVARLRSLSRRCLPGDRGKLKVDDLELDTQERTASRDGVTIPLEEREFELLEYMMCNHDRVLAYEELVDQISLATSDASQRDVDDTVEALRPKLNVNGKRPLIHKVDDRGYMLSDMPPLVD